MLRNFIFMNNVVTDDNIYFIENDIFEKYVKNCLLKEGKDNKNKYLIFPSNKDTMYYSSEYHIFNDTYIDDDLINRNSIYNILEKTKIYDETTNKTYYKFEHNPINCDLVRIYHPSIKSKENLIIHIENVINNIHFHYLCKNYQWYFSPENNQSSNKYNSNSEYKFENNIYSEYIKCYIPSIRELFDRIIIGKDQYDYKWYFNENLNVVNDISDQNLSFINKTIIKTAKDENGNEYITDNENDIINQYVPLALFTQPFLLQEYHDDKNNNDIIEPDEILYEKLYFKYKFRLDNSYITTPLNISLYPYTSLNETTKIYTLSDKLLPGTTSIIDDYNFKLIGKIDFNNDGNISLISYFDYPFKYIYDMNYGDSLTEAYCFFHHIVNRNSVYISNLKSVYFEELDEINSINDIDDETIKFLIDSKLADKNPILSPEYPTRKDYYIAKLKESHWQVFLEEYIDEFKANVDFFGFRIEIASDKNFKNIILSENISLLNLYGSTEQAFENALLSDDLDLFANLKNGLFFFPLSGIFTNWKQMPDIVVARITFIDRFIGNELVSNDIFISKEKFKYITNINTFKRINQLVDLNKNYNNDMIELNLNNNYGKTEFDEIVNSITDSNKEKLIEWYNKYGNNHYNFINKINCKVQNSVNEYNENKYNKSNNSNKTNIIYKPIFFKTNKLNNVQIKYKQNQNIGIDLHEYLSKVNLFILSLDGNTYYEIGRNSNYVLFSINATNLKNEMGTFEIYNSDHEYITYGTWSILR